MNYTEEELLAIQQRLAKDQSYVDALQVVSNALPEFKEKIYQEAEDSLKGMILLPGTGGVKKFVGNPPTWFVRMGNDNEFLWQLSRMNHWIEMLQRYTLSHEKEYAEKVIQEFEDWHKEVFLTMNHDLLEKDPTYYNGVHPLRLLECGIRLYKTWPFILRYLAGTEFLTTEVLGHYMTSVHMQASIIYKYAPILWPKADHNHYLMENLGLLTTALMFPEFPESETWKKHAIHELNRGSMAQLTPAGGQIEGCPSYHNGCMFWFGLLPILAEKYKFSLPEGYLERYKSALNYSISCLRPDGKTTPFGDSHANDGSIMAASIGYLVTKNDYWLRHLLAFYTKDTIVEKAIANVRFGNQPEEFLNILEVLSPLPKEELLPTTFYNHQLGQLFVRDGWEQKSYFAGLTARSPIQNGHAHIDMLTFEFSALGKTIICDPGLFAYRDDSDRVYFKTVKSHSTVMINNQDFFPYLSSFGFGADQKESHLIALHENEEVVWCSGYNLAYEPTKITRHFIFIKKIGLVLIDVLSKGNEEDEVRRNFHFDYTNFKIKNGNEAIAIDENINTKIVNYPEQMMNISYGRLSDINDIYRSSQEVSFTNKGSNNLYVTALYPYKKDEAEPEMKINVENNIVKIQLNKRSLLAEVGADEIGSVYLR